MPTVQDTMTAKLRRIGIPYRNISVYGRQIVITTSSRNTADKWAKTLSPKIAKLKGLIESSDLAKVNRGTVLKPTRIKVWRTYFTI